MEIEIQTFESFHSENVDLLDILSPYGQIFIRSISMK